MSNKTDTIITRYPYDGHEFQVFLPASTREGQLRVTCPYCTATHTIRIANAEHALKEINNEQKPM